MTPEQTAIIAEQYAIKFIETFEKEINGDKAEVIAFLHGVIVGCASIYRVHDVPEVVAQAIAVAVIKEVYSA